MTTDDRRRPRRSTRSTSARRPRRSGTRSRSPSGRSATATAARRSSTCARAASSAHRAPASRCGPRACRRWWSSARSSSPTRRGASCRPGDPVWDEQIAAERPSRLTYELEQEAGRDGVTRLTVIHELEGAPLAAAMVLGRGRRRPAAAGPSSSATSSRCWRPAPASRGLSTCAEARRPRRASALALTSTTLEGLRCGHDWNPRRRRPHRRRGDVVARRRYRNRHARRALHPLRGTRDRPPARRPRRALRLPTQGGRRAAGGRPRRAASRDAGQPRLGARPIEAEDDVQEVLALLRLNYDRATASRAARAAAGSA